MYNKLYCQIFEKNEDFRRVWEICFCTEQNYEGIQEKLPLDKKDTRNNARQTDYSSLPRAFAVSNQKVRVESDKKVLSLHFRLAKV